MILDVKKHNMAANWKNICNPLNTSRALALCIDTHMCTNSEIICMNEEKNRCVSNKEFLSDHRYERTNITASCKIFDCDLKPLLAMCIGTLMLTISKAISMNGKNKDVMLSEVSLLQNKYYFLSIVSFIRSCENVLPINVIIENIILYNIIWH